MKDYKNITFEVIDINVNTTPDIFINRNHITFSKRVLEDLGYPTSVQYCIGSEEKVFAIRVCKSNESKAVAFAKSKGEQTSSLSTSNKNIVEAIRVLMPKDHDPDLRYKVVGHFR